MFSVQSLPGRRYGLGIVLALILAASAGCGSATDDRPATWSFISAAIIEPGCATANCHSALADRASVDLSGKAIGYYTLTARQFVTPGDTDRSELLHLLHAEGNLRMPPDEPLPEIDIQLITNWIAAGAMDN